MQFSFSPHTKNWKKKQKTKKQHILNSTDILEFWIYIFSYFPRMLDKRWFCYSRMNVFKGFWFSTAFSTLWLKNFFLRWFLSFPRIRIQIDCLDKHFFTKPFTSNTLVCKMFKNQYENMNCTTVKTYKDSATYSFQIFTCFNIFVSFLRTILLNASISIHK